MDKRSARTGGKVEQGRLLLLQLLQAEKVTDADIAAVRRHAFGGRGFSRVEIEDLFAIDAVVRPDGDAWVDLFVQIVTDFIVWDQRPTGVLDEAQATWLIAKADAAKTASSFAVLINILDQAHRVPRWFPAAVRSRAVAGWPGLMTVVDAAEGGVVPRAA